MYNIIINTKTDMNRSRRPSAYTSTPAQHLAAKVEVYPKGSVLPAHIENGERKGFVICNSKV
jgi:hypothetical protein